MRGVASEAIVWSRNEEGGDGREGGRWVEWAEKGFRKVVGIRKSIEYGHRRLDIEVDWLQRL